MWEQKLKECTHPVDVLRLTFPRVREGKLTQDDADRLMKLAYKIHPEWKKEPKGEWSEVPQNTGGYVDVTKAYQAPQKLDFERIRNVIAKNENPITLFIFQMLVDMKRHPIGEIDQAIHVKFNKIHRETRRNVSTIRDYFDVYMKEYTVSSNVGKKEAIYQIIKK